MNTSKIKSAEELEKRIDRYFETLEPEYRYDSEGEMLVDSKTGMPIMTDRKPATISSMIYEIGLTSKDDLMKLKRRRGFENTVKRALLRVEAYTEMMLFDKSAASGAKFLLESCFGWTDEAPEKKGAENGVVVLADIEEADKL